MAYYFMIEKKRGQYETLNIDSILGDVGKKKYSKDGAYSLRELDMFTMQYNDELELRKSLFYENIVGPEYIDKPLSIRSVSNGVYNKVPYDFLYQKDIELVFDPSRLINLILDRYNANDFLFIKKFAEVFASYRECSTTAPEVRTYADMAIRADIGNKYLEEVDQNGYNMVERLVRLLLFEHFEYPNGYIDYKDKIKYRNLHMVVAFINNYDKKYGKSVSLEKDSLDEFLLMVKPKIKKRVKRRQELPGQISFFDQLDDDNK